MHRLIWRYHIRRAQKISSESRLYGRDNSYHHPSLLPSSPRCFLLFSSRWFIRVRAPLWPPCVVVVEVEKKRRKKNENQYSDRNALERERHAGCQHRRVVDTFCSKKGGGLPVSAQSINVLRLSILFPSVFVLRPACHPTRAASASAVLDLRPPPLSPLSRGRECPWSPHGGRTLFWSRHTASQDALDCRLSPGITRRSF